MNDLDARMAVIIELIKEYADLRVDGDIDHWVPKLRQVEQAIRTELQKPALHEPVILPSFRDVPVRVEDYPHGYQEGYSWGWNDCLRWMQENNTQGRAQPAQAEITDAERLDWLIEYGYVYVNGRDAIDALIRASKGEQK